MPFEKRKKRAKVPAGSQKDIAMPDHDWEARQDLDSLIRAKAVKKDPARHQRAKAHAKQRLDEYKGKRAEAQAAINMAKD